tara:strand:- start:4245 stop:6491 length:2247 start_codon:yes stop_codon:yes gene_type:complete
LTKETISTFKIYFVGVALFAIITLLNSMSTPNIESSVQEEQPQENLSQPESLKSYCNGLSYNEAENHSLENINHIYVQILDNRGWNLNLMSAYIDNGKIIDVKYKKKYDAEIKFTYKNNTECTFSSRVRINGDWVDHIKQLQNGQLISSLDIELIEGNVQNITKFKLFLPETRLSDNEIFVTTMMEQLGFLTPKTQKVYVNLNGNTSPFLFQEKIVKEMIENNLYRENAILEFNEQEIWKNRLNFKSSEDVAQSPIYAKINNLNWASLNEYNFKGSVKAIQYLNQLLFDSKNQYDELNFTSLKNRDQLLMFEVANIALSSEHALVNHNRKFFYNPIKDILEPIYYDGNSYILEKGDDIANYITNYINSRLHKNQILLGVQLLNKKLDQNPIDKDEMLRELNNKGFEVSNEELNNHLNYFYENLNLIFEVSIESNSQEYLKGVTLNFTEIENFTKLKIIEDLMYECTINDNSCVPLTDTEQYKETNKQTKNILIGLDSQPMNVTKNYLIENTTLITYYEPYVNIDIESKTIEIILTNNKQRALFIDGKLENWHIDVNIDENIKTLDARANENSLTGCTTFYSVEFNKISINSRNSFCEDSINIMKSKGLINYIEINNSKFDGLDLDYSNIEIDKIDINLSGNDCLDLSAGKYVINALNVNICDDKGISIGERSQVLIESFSGQSTFLAIAVKDSSAVLFENFLFQNTNQCVAMYRKKPEFGPSKLNINTYNCTSSEEDYIQVGSVFNSP